MIVSAVKVLVISLGLISLFKPVVLIYTFMLLPVVIYLPTLTGHLENFHLITIGHINVYGHDFLIIVMALNLFLFFLRDHQCLSILKTPLSIIIIVIFIWYIVIAALSWSKGFHFVGLMRKMSTISIIFLALYIPLIHKIEEKQNNILKYSVLLAVLLLIFSFVRYTITHDIVITSSGTARSIDAISVVVLMFAFCYLIFLSNVSKSFILSFLILLIFSSGIVLAGHRSGIIVIMIAFIIYVVYNFTNIFKSLSIAAFGASFFLLLVLFLSMYEFEPGETFIGDTYIRFMDTFDFENPTTEGRLSYWLYSLSVLKDSPFIGKGSFPVYLAYMGDIRIPPGLEAVALPRSPHNLFAEIIIYEGLAGLTVLFLLFFAIIKHLSVKSINHFFVTFIGTYLFVFFIYSFFNTTYSSIAGRIYLFTAIGLLNSYYYNNIYHQPVFDSCRNNFT